MADESQRHLDWMYSSTYLKILAMTNTASDSNDNLTARSARSLSVKSIAWWQGYLQTEGLSVFRSQERYAVWLHAHRRLMAENSLYAADTRWFWTCGALSGLLSLSLWISLQLIAPAATFALASGVLLCYREQRRRNAAIAEQLQAPA